MLGDKVFYWSKTHKKYFVAFITAVNDDGTVNLFVLFDDSTNTYTTQKANFVSFVRNGFDKEYNHWLTKEDFSRFPS